METFEKIRKFRKQKITCSVQRMSYRKERKIGCRLTKLTGVERAEELKSVRRIQESEFRKQRTGTLTTQVESFIKT